MNKEPKQFIAENSWLFALLFGAGGFGLVYWRLSTSQWQTFPAVIGAVIGFLVFGVGSFMIFNNVVDAYSLESAEEAQGLYRTIKKIRASAHQISTQSTKTYQTQAQVVAGALTAVCDHTTVLVQRVAKYQPSNLLSSITVSEKMLDILVEGLDDLADTMEHPEFAQEPDAQITRAANAFRTYDGNIVKSIQTIKRGNTSSFEAAMQMLEATQFNSVKR